MATKRRLTPKMVTAMQLIAKGSSNRQAMLKAGYSKSAAGNPRKNLLSKPQVLSIIDQMKLTLDDAGVNGQMLALKLANFAKSDNPKVFFRAYDRIGKIVGIEPTQSQLGGIPKRQVTFTEWVDTGATEARPVKEDNNDDLIAFDKIKLDRFDEPLDSRAQEDKEAREFLDKYGEPDKELIY